MLRRLVNSISFPNPIGILTVVVRDSGYGFGELTDLSL